MARFLLPGPWDRTSTSVDRELTAKRFYRIQRSNPLTDEWSNGAIVVTLERYLFPVVKGKRISYFEEFTAFIVLSGRAARRELRDVRQERLFR